MSKGYHVGDLRAAIEQVSNAEMSESKDGEALNEDVIKRLKQERPDLIRAFTNQLIDMALTKLLNEVSRKRAKASNSIEQASLFAGFGKIPGQVTTSREHKKATVNLTLAEAEKWLDSRRKPIVKDPHADFRNMLERCRNHATSDQEKLSDILTRIQAPLI